ncbi:MAG: hypothetical protein FJX92_08045 [Bacteroidetes bacterium]|nr:hypothetical protein [Bacteroidota bacterium]
MADNPIHKQPTPEAIDPQEILRYNSGQMSEQEAHELEARALDDPFLSDAIKGMENSADQVRLQQMAYALNQDLKRRLSRNQKRKRWIGFESPSWWTWITLILLMLITLAYLFIRKLGG